MMKKTIGGELNTLLCQWIDGFPTKKKATRSSRVQRTNKGRQHMNTGWLDFDLLEDIFFNYETGESYDFREEETAVFDDNVINLAEQSDGSFAMPLGVNG